MPNRYLVVSGTVPVATPVSSLMCDTITVLLKDSVIWLRMVCSTWLDSRKQFMDRLCSLRVLSMTAGVPTLLDRIPGWTGRT